MENIGRFQKGHTPYNKGKSIINSGSFKAGEQHRNWKEKIGYSGVHGWLRRNFGKADHCMNGCLAKAYDWANISGEYRRDINDFESLCRRCHMIKDGRLETMPHVGWKGPHIYGKGTKYTHYNA